MWGRQDTNRVKTITSRVAIAATIILFAGIGWFGIKQYRCKQRNAAFSRRVKTVEQDAHKQLRVGTKKDDVARFYREHEIPFEVVGSEAIGTLYSIGGCAPLGCGTDNALIGVRVKVDADGTVTGEPKVVSMYTDCL
jgi:hypothetical protein